MLLKLTNQSIILLIWSTVVIQMVFKMSEDLIFVSYDIVNNGNMNKFVCVYNEMRIYTITYEINRSNAFWIELFITVHIIGWERLFI